MPPALTKYFAKITGGAKSFTVGQKTVALIGIAVLILGGIALSSWISKPSYTPLFSGLAAADASAIVEQLDASGVPYELTAGGATILVPQENVYAERLTAAAAGLPSSSAGGYSLLDDMGVTSSEFQQDVTYKRAIEGELSKTISALDGVTNATVQLAVPSETVFAAEKAAPTASVFVETKSGQALSGEKVQAIVHLTSAAIEGMTPANVAVIDANGNVLSAVGSGAIGGSEKQATDYEARVGANVQAMLDKVLGAGNATVAVAADLSTETGEKVEETFSTPADAPALNESENTEKYTGTGNGAAGVLGPDNIAVPGDGAKDGEYESGSTVKNNAVNKLTEKTAIPAGTLTRQSVSVVVDSAAAAGLNAQNITDMVNTAAGINAERGDAVNVEIVPFNTAASEAAEAALAEAKEAEAKAARAELIKSIIIAAGILAAVVAALVVFAVRSRRQNRSAIELASAVEPDVELVSVSPIVMPEPATTAIPLQVDLPEPADAEVLRTAVTAMAERQPEKTAEYLRGMMDEKATS